MRTTVTLDADTEQLIRGRMKERGGSFKEVLNEAIREGLRPRRGSKVIKTPTFDMGLPAINLDRALEVADAIEDEELIRKERSRK